jgi:hypothetical protein
LLHPLSLASCLLRLFQLTPSHIEEAVALLALAFITVALLAVASIVVALLALAFIAVALLALAFIAVASIVVHP